MTRVVLDINVLVSAVLARRGVGGHSRRLVERPF